MDQTVSYLSGEPQLIPEETGIRTTIGDAFVLIPTTLISREALKYVGLSETKTNELWSKWTNWPDSGPRRETDVDDGELVVPFIDFIVGHLENQHNTVEDDDIQWRSCLTACGIDANVQDAIMDPQFNYLRLSESCLYWAKDTVEMRYAELKMALRREASHPSGRERRVSQNGGGPSSSIGQCSEYSTQQQDTPGIGSDIWGPASAITAHNAFGHTLLFKGIDWGRISSLFNEAGDLANIGVLLSPFPSDFSGTRSLFYFTSDHQVAQYYAGYAKRRGCRNAVIVCLRLPNAAIESLSAPQIQRAYWPSSEWKELVWCCRSQSRLPSHLRKYRRAVLVIGSMSRKPAYIYRAMASRDEVTEDCLLQMPGRNHPAVQYAFSGKEDFLFDHCAQNIKVFSYPLSQSELQAWLADNSVEYL